MQPTLQQMLAIVEADFAKEVWRFVAVVSLHLAAFAVFAWLFKVTDFVGKLLAAYRKHPISLSLSLPLFVYAATKVPLLVPVSSQCDYRIGSEVDVTDGLIGYVRMVGETMPTNIQVACCGNVVTNELTFSRSGQFYIETIQHRDLDLRKNPFWVRDSETNDWTRATADMYFVAESGVTWVHGWTGMIAHLPDSYGDPKDYRYWFVGPEENLPEKVVEGGVGIKIDFFYRDAHHVLVRFHSDDPDLVDATYVLQGRTVEDGTDVLGDWQTLASTTGGVFDVRGNFVQRYNEMRVYADKEGGE